MYMIFLFGFLVIFVLILSYCKNKEKFIGSDTKYKVYTTSIENNINWIPKNWEIMNIKDYTKMNENTLYICDPLDYDEYYQSYKIIDNSPEGIFVMLVDINRANKKNCVFNCSYDLQNKVIGYYDKSDLYFIKSIINSYRQDMSSIRLIKLKYNDKIDFNNIDLVITYVIPESNFNKWIIKQMVSIYGFNNLDINRIRLFYPYVQLKNISRNELTNKLINNDTPNPSISINENNTQIPIMKMKVIQVKTIENFVDRLVYDAEAVDPEYKCFGDMENKNKTLCNSKYDINGDLKKKITIWDRPCRVDTDCPFYKSNKNYPNNRGKCLEEGMCELPIGVQRLGFTKYNDKNEYSPFCYGCNEINCCNKQKNPDYAFKNDKDERQKYELNTYIKM